MRRKFILCMAMLAGLFGASAPRFSASAQGAPSLDEQLQAQFQLARTNGAAVLTPGTVLVIQKGGISAVPPAGPAAPASKCQDGQCHAPSQKMGNLLRQYVPQIPQQNLQPLAVGTRIYPTSISLGRDTVTMEIFAFENPAKAKVEFHFGGGALQKMGVTQIVDAIAQVLAFDQTADPAQPTQPPQPPPPAEQPPATSGPSAPVEPPTVKDGQTVEQVVAIMGQPERKAVVGDTKLIYFYKDAKITFINGKVSDIQ